VRKPGLARSALPAIFAVSCVDVAALFARVHGGDVAISIGRLAHGWIRPVKHESTLKLFVSLSQTRAHELASFKN
jgi:hypothetical protein